ncbi:uncharacterized protein LOC126260575 [Schistocerca nitens]|uniref:uncharacterized protein LOC126260575 n=1 Tax=Schistocerca nitens TaxID=7011 RepID=UPI002117EBBB|nr:uncharacterized protein LOC126260575 [Schistocerca nitens]
MALLDSYIMIFICKGSHPITLPDPVSHSTAHSNQEATGQLTQLTPTTVSTKPPTAVKANHPSSKRSLSSPVQTAVMSVQPVPGLGYLRRDQLRSELRIRGKALDGTVPELASRLHAALGLPVNIVADNFPALDTHPTTRVITWQKAGMRLICL